MSDPKIDDRGSSAAGPKGTDVASDDTLRPGMGEPGDREYGVAGTGSGGSGGIPLGDEPEESEGLESLLGDADELDGDVDDGVVSPDEDDIAYGGPAGAASGE